jgi:oligopeptide transport system substrate-binding protein
MKRACLPLSVALLVLTSGCSRTTPVEAARAENKLLITVGSEPSTLDPHRSTGSPESFIMSALWEPLIDWNETATGFVPAAAESWTLSPDGRTYTFHLRPTAKWSNGEPVTARDWVRSWQRWWTPSLAAELANFGDPIVGVFAFRTGQTTDPATLGLREIDTYTLEIKLVEPDVLFLDRLTNYPWFPVHEASVTAAGGFFDPRTDFVRPGILVSNGPYQMTAWKHGQYVEVSRNPHFHGTTRLDAIRFLAFDSLDTTERAFRSGQLHITDSVPASKVAVYRDAHDPAYLSYPRVGTRFLSLNTTRPPFDDPRVRRAFSLALDRQKLVEFVLRTGGTPAYAMIKALPSGHQPTALITESVTEARRLLAAAGYPNGDNFPPVEYLYNTLDRNRQIAEALQQMWATALGVKITLRNEEWKVFLDTRRQLDYHIARTGWLPFSPEPAELYELQTTHSPSNETGWSDATYDQLVESARREMDPVRRFALYDQLDQILVEAAPVIPWGHYARNRLVDPSISGWPQNHMEALVWTRLGFRHD